jgi:putative ABC transport system permease protein
MAPIELSTPGLTAAAVGNRVRAIDGVSSSALASSVFWSRAESATILVEGRSEAVTISSVSPNFFQTLGVSMDSGNELMSDAPSQVLISRSSAERLWPRASALHQTFRTSEGSAFSVGGVVRDTELDRRSPVPRVYRVMSAAPSKAIIVVRSEGDVTFVSKQLTLTLDSMGILGRELPRTIDADIREIGSRFRVTAGFATFFGLSAFALALIGVYSVMAFAVSRRTKEMGIRLALGATRPDIVREVLRSGLTPVGWGLVAGLPVAAGFAIGLERAFRNTPTPFHALDPLAFGPIVVVLIAGAAIAMLRPALRACSTNPATSLRAD